MPSFSRLAATEVLGPVEWGQALPFAVMHLRVDPIFLHPHSAKEERILPARFLKVGIDWGCGF
jgi:hypothetical protein